MSQIASAGIKGRTKNDRHGQSLTDHDVHEYIYKAIVEHRLTPGTKLTEEALAETFGVGRMRIRTVLNTLSHSRLINLEPNRGAFVAQPTAAEAREVFAARRMIEAAIIREAVQLATPGQIAALRGIIAEEHAALERNDKRAAIQLSADFHLKIAESVENQSLLRFMRELTSRTSLAIALFERPGRSSCQFNEHEALLQHFEVKDSDAAAKAMSDHLTSIESELDLSERPVGDVDLKKVFGDMGLSS
jgi:DNA-binding GntR family transcriptional regulator